MANATTVKIDKFTQKTLKELAQQRGTSMQSILREAILEYRRRQFLEDTNAAYEALKSNPKAWQEELEERKLWDNTIADGLDPEEEWSADRKVTHKSKRGKTNV